MSKPGENHDVVLDAEKNERTKRIYRYVSDVARRLDEAIASCGSTPELFKTSIEVQRQKLRDNCEKLMFLDPLNYGKKALELLWRKVYYDSVSAAKKLNESEVKFDNYLFTHIVSGIGQFHNIITKIKSHTKLKLKELDYDCINIEDEFELKDEIEPTEELQQWGRSTVHSCLIYLGDLSRYQSEIFHTFEPSIAARYYLQAAYFDISSGMPYNQLGNLYMEQNYNLTSVCYYIHCLSCLNPFEGSHGNLIKIFEKNEQLAEIDASHNYSQSEHIQNTISKFLSLIEIWYFGKEDIDVPKRCNDIAQDLRIAFEFKKVALPDINKNYEEYTLALEEEIINPSYLNSNVVHEMVQICLFTVAKIVESDIKKSFAAKAFSLALLSQLLHIFLQQLKKIGFKNPASKYVRKPSFQETKLTNEDHGAMEESVVVVNGTNGINHKNENIIDIEIETTEEIQEAKDKENGNKNINNKKSMKRRRRRRLDSSASSELSDESASEESDDTEKSDSEKDDIDDDASDSSYESDSKSEVSDNECSDIEIVTNKNIANEKQNEIVKNNNNNIIENDIEKLDIKEIENGDKSSKSSDKTKTDVPLNESEIQNFLRDANFLPSMKLLQDWVLKEKDLILSCGESGRSLFQCVVDLLNIVEYYFKRNLESKDFDNLKILQYARSVAKDLKLEYKNIPLPEDVNLRGTNICKFDANAAEWNILDQYKPTVYEENVVRILNFIHFGHEIVKLVPKIRFNRTLQIFYLKKSPVSKLSTKINHHKRSREWHNSKKPHVEGGLLRRLGRLWLTAQVQELERGGEIEPTLLALDAQALSAQLHHVRHIHASKSFMILVPTVVLQELDDMKRDQLSAREAIRWLESQLQRGSRFLRAQKPGQNKPLPLLKYPKKLPSQTQNFIQILEFCYHFVGEEKPQGQGDADHKPPSMLVLLTGHDKQTLEEQFKEFSMTGVAQSAGISLENINTFYTKWRQTVKSGKKR